MSNMIRFDERVLSDGYGYSFGISAGDITGNGSMDVVSTDTGVGLYMYENDGSGNFTKHVLHQRNSEWLERNVIADINNDGKLEIICVDNSNGSLLWFEFDGDPRDARSWSYHYICDGELPGAYDVAVADFDGDGQLEVVASSWTKARNFTYYDRQAGHWVKTVIDSGLGETRAVIAADINGDGRPDLLGTDSGQGHLIWYENPGDPSNTPWPRHLIDKTSRPNQCNVVDMDGDGDVDVVVASAGEATEKLDLERPGAQIAWYENIGNNNWRKHIIADQFHQAFEAVAADIDGDGQIEVVATAWGLEGRIAVFKHRGDPRGVWDMQVLKEKWMKANQVILADLDNDGLLDVVASAERGSNEVRWWHNNGTL